jgi:iron complex outermembrane receptor protein
MMNKQWFRAGLLVGCSVMGLAAGAAAQDARVEEIVVTAERREANLQATPVAVTAITAAALENRQIINTIDLAVSVPNLSLVEATANPSNLAIGLRGASEGVGGLSVSESPVGFYIDDVYHARMAGTNLEFTDIERIEVLRGPQGTLYGRNTLAGAIKVVTRKPGETSWADGTLGYGSRDEIVAKGSVGGPLSGALAGSAAIVYHEGDGYKFNRATGRRNGDYENVSGRVSLQTLGDEEFSVFASVYGASDKNDGYLPTPATYPVRPATNKNLRYAAGDVYTNQSPTPSYGKTKQWGATLDASYRWAETTLRSITGYIYVDDEFRADFTGGVQTGPTTFIAGFDRTSLVTNKQFSQEFQLLGTAADGQLDWILGAFYFHETGDQIIKDLLGPLALLPTTFDLKTDGIAAFAQGTYRLTDELSAVAGIRWSQDDKSMDATIQRSFIPPFQLAAISLDKKFVSVTPKVGLEYQATPETLLYVSAARGFKGGGFNGLAVANPLIIATPYREATVWSYEGGVKTDLLDNRLRLNGAVFLAKYKDLQQVANIDPVTFSFAIQNVGDATVYGAELEMVAVPTDGLTITGQLGLVDDEYDRLSPLSSAALNNAKRVNATPRTTAQIAFDFTAPIAAGGNELAVLLGSSLSYKGSYFASVDNTLLTEGATRINGYVGVGDGENRWSLRLEARNLANKKESVGATTASAGVVTLPPRQIMLMARVAY